MTDTATKDGPMLVRTILLLPRETTRERLLAPHAPSCRRVAGALTFGTITGGSPSHTEQYAIKPVKSFDYPVNEHVHLVLARSGAVVPEGVDRLCRVMRWDARILERRILAALLHGMRPGVHDLPGTLLLLDADGKEVPGV